MSGNDNKSQESNNDNPLISQGKGTNTDNSKRRLLKGVIGSTPIIMAASSKPVLAGWCTVSGFLSGNLSAHNQNRNCGGRSPGYWKRRIRNYPEGGDSVTFLYLFGAVWKRGATNGYASWPTDGQTPSLKKVLSWGGDDDLYEFGAHAIAAYMNAKYISNYGMTTADVGNIVGQILYSGSYTDATTGQVLSPEQIVDFIQQTFS